MSEKFNNILLRDFKPEDYPQVIDLWLATGLGGAQRGDNLEVITRTLAHGGKLIILTDTISDKIIGTSWLTNDFRRIYLHHFCIDPAFQGKGLSHPLVIASVDYARLCGLQIKLEVHKDNTKAIELYKKHNFSFLGDYMVYIIRNL
ncbi:MAG: hypothetical protein CVU05_10095 [Bacteroidetes bacterium HGW-Bacteroidetes-21]|nr:MAG: hypothetical protein CVU05_10095 [Bacteroidetes bacterium HGW-Bacteroidetes-21]